MNHLTTQTITVTLTPAMQVALGDALFEAIENGSGSAKQRAYDAFSALAEAIKAAEAWTDTLAMADAVKASHKAA